MKSITLFLTLLLTTATMGCAQDIAWSSIINDIRSKYSDVEHITADSLAFWLESSDNQAPVLLDVREKKEYEVSHLPGAIQIDPNTKRFKKLADIPKDTPIVAYCSVGYRSSEMARRLQKAGFTNVSNLEGSIFTWANEAHPVFSDSTEVYGVHPYNGVWGQLLQPKLRKYDP